MCICVPLAICAESKLEQDFKTPPPAARLQAYWFWVDSNFSTNGITKDLEAMKSAGFGAALILNVGSGALANPPWPDQTYHSQKYFDAIKHAAAEAERLGLTIGLAKEAGPLGIRVNGHHCPDARRWSAGLGSACRKMVRFSHRKYADLESTPSGAEWTHGQPGSG